MFEAAGAAQKFGIRSMTTMKGSTEFSTWVALAFGAIAIAICAVFSSSLWALIPAGLAGGGLGYWVERVARHRIERALSNRRAR